MNSSNDSKKEIHDLMRKKTNSYCADCSDPCALYVDMDNKIFLCQNCALIHRQFGFEVKNVATDDFSPEESESLRSSSNQTFNNHWMANYNYNSQKIPFGASLTERKAFLTDKYLTKQWFSPFYIHNFSFDNKQFQIEEEYSDNFEQQSPFASSSDQSDFSDVSSPTDQPFFGMNYQKSIEIEAPSIQQAVDMPTSGFASYSSQNIPPLSQARQQFPYTCYNMPQVQPQQQLPVYFGYGQPQMQQSQPQAFGAQIRNQQSVPQEQSFNRMQQFQQKPESRIRNYMAQQGIQPQQQPQSQSRYNQAQILQSIEQIAPQQGNQAPVCMESLANSSQNDYGCCDLIQQQPFIQNSYASQNIISNQNPFDSNQNNQVLNSNSNPFKNQSTWQKTNSYKNQSSKKRNSGT